MLGAIYIGLSGMNAYSKGLQTISNNVANLNSPGFKATSVRFTDVFNYRGSGGLSYLGSSVSNSNGGGVSFGKPSINFGGGELRASDGDLDLAVDGGGFMVLLKDGETLYGRTGRFVVAEDGYIVLEGTENRLAVLNADGQAVAVNVDTKKYNMPVATTKVVFGGNLAADATTSTVSDIAVYDANGTKQVWRVVFTRVGAASAGQWTFDVLDQSGQTLEDDLSLKFASNGNFVDPTTSQFLVNTAADGEDPRYVTLDFSFNVRSVSSGGSSDLTATPDGNATGTLTGVTLDADGQIKLTYSNTKTELMGQVALADFRDPQKLERVGDGLFANRDGAYHRLLKSKQDGVGELKSKVLEASNVDLSMEFGDLILIQRGFQASSQVVSVTNDMIQQLFGIRGQG